VAFLIAVGSGHFYASDEEKMYGTTLRMWQAIQHLFNPAVTVDTPILTPYADAIHSSPIHDAVRDIFGMAGTRRNAGMVASAP
jgi:hypothetical protein